MLVENLRLCPEDFLDANVNVLVVNSPRSIKPIALLDFVG